MYIQKFLRPLALTALIASSTFVAQAQPGKYEETDLVVNKQVKGIPTLVDSNGITHIAKFFDPNLRNPWGIAESSTSAFWIADGGAGVATLYNTAGQPQSLIVNIPGPGNPLGNDGIPDGALFNPLPAAQHAFQVTGIKTDGTPITAPAVFLFATKNGTIVGWNPAVNPVGFDPAKAGKYGITAVTSPGAVYTGLAMATDASGVTRLYAADFIGGKIDVLDANFKPMNPGAFTDRYLPRGYAPFNIAAIEANGATRMFVTYAINDLSKIFGQGRGVVNAFALDGTQATRFAQHGQLDAPWAVVMTPRTFGDLGGNVWIGNFGGGNINAYDPATGAYVGKVRDTDGKSVAIDGLWMLKFGNGSNGGDLDKLYFTASPNGETDGIFGFIVPK